jgi:rhodanese-related sulfurtransferase
MDDSRLAISPAALYRRLGTGSSPIVIDVRRPPAFDDDQTLVAGAIRRTPSDVAEWGRQLQPGQPVVVYCVHGHEVSQQAAQALRAAGVDAVYLQGGKTEWMAQGLPTRRKHDGRTGAWITRERPKVDRVACPWLVRRFIDPQAKFLYAPAGRVFDEARATDSIPYDIAGAEPFSHVGDECSFDGFLKVFDIADPALGRLASIVRGADTDRPELAPQAAGLLAISLGLSANHADDDQAMLANAMIVYDALYAWCRSLQEETHQWIPSA